MKPTLNDIHSLHPGVVAALLHRWVSEVCLL